MTDNPGLNGNQGFQPNFGHGGNNNAFQQPGQGYRAQGYQPQGQGYQQPQQPFQPYQPQGRGNQQPGQDQGLQPQQPGQSFATQAPKKRNSGLIVLVCILSALCLLLSAGLVYMFVNQDKSDITKGIVPVGELLELEIPELDAKAFSPYTLFLPGEDAAVVIMQTANGAKMQKFITATTKKTAEKVGDLIDLPACPTNSTRPYVVKGSDVVCSEKPVIVKNENKNYEFNETVYTSETIIIGASPSAAEATQIVAYQPGNNQPLWVENLNTPASVSTNGETICTAVTDETGKIDIQGYVGAEKQTQTQTAKPSKKVLAPDFMKNYDYANTYLPSGSSEKCSAASPLEAKTPYDRAFSFTQVPDTDTECWAKLITGKVTVPYEQENYSSCPPEGCNFEISLGRDSFNSINGFETAVKDGVNVAYADLNQDGYLDAISYNFRMANFATGAPGNLAIFLANPDDPEHPYVGIGGYVGNNEIISYDGSGTISIQSGMVMGGRQLVTFDVLDGKPVGYIQDVR